MSGVDWLVLARFFDENAGVFLAFVGVLGLIVGSFINVVVHRIPIIMMNEWRDEIGKFIAQDNALNDAINEQARKDICQIYQSNQQLSLSVPRSHCPHCQSRIAWYHNIPVLSYLLLMGRCASCRTKISPSYLITELTVALLSMLIAHHFGVGVQTLFGLILLWYLLALSLIDIKTQLLPDRLLVPVGIIGLMANLWGVFAPLDLAVWGLVVGFVSFWLINVLFRAVTGKDGMGLGDAKLLGVLGAWLGVVHLPMVVFVAALLGVVAGVLGNQRHQAFAFGPYLAIGGMAALLYGERFWAWYLGII